MGTRLSGQSVTRPSPAAVPVSPRQAERCWRERGSGPPRDYGSRHAARWPSPLRGRCRSGAGFLGGLLAEGQLAGGGLGHRERGGAWVSLPGLVLAASSQLSQAPRPCVPLPVRAELSPSLCPPHPSAFSGLAPVLGSGRGEEAPSPGSGLASEGGEAHQHCCLPPFCPASSPGMSLRSKGQRHTG